ncbi:MAG: DUF5615 family PIN-like protein [Acidobacteria bacterium]|nr:DUF5615 family PIN-like protein [Acidobacteriota bacterium]
MKRFLLDENIPLASVDILRDAGHDITVASTSPGSPDRDLLQLAAAEERIVLTFDRDFGSLVFKERAAIPAGVIFLRFIPATPQEPASVVQMLLEHPEIDLPGKFTTVTRQRIRQRDLPTDEG